VTITNLYMKELIGENVDGFSKTSCQTPYVLHNLLCMNMKVSIVAVGKRKKRRSLMTANQLPDAPEMLKLPPDKFMVEVSRTGVFVPKPWPHEYGVKTFHYTKNRITAHAATWQCIYCDRTQTCVKPPTRKSCQVPPIITDSLADVAEALRKKATINGRANLFRAVYHTMKNVAWPDMTSWWFDAPFKERIACCLVALGYWQVNKEKEKS